jgi:hypothetical protein
MKLKDVLAGKSQIRIKEYEAYGDGIIVVGGAFYDGRRILPLDGKFYPMEMKLEAAEWEDDETLMIVR